MDETVTVSAVNVYPSGQSVYISTRGQLGFARHGSCENEIQLIAQAATPTRSWTLIGCSPPGDGTVYLKTRYQGRTITLDTISIDVWAAPTMPTGTPVAVSNLSAAASTTSARLTWARLDGAEKYRVAHRAGGTTGNWLNPVETTARAHTVPNLAPGTSYQFRVRAYGDGETYLAEWGAEATITASTLDTTPSKPPPPAGFTASASADTAGRVTLTWDTRAGVARYEVRYRRGSGSWTVRPNITGTGSKITHHVDGLTCGASHDFRVKAYGDGATYLAEWGDEAEDDAAPLCNPDAPGGLNASAPGENSVSVSWTALTGADKYAVRYQQGSSGDWAEYRDDITGTSPTVSGLRCDTGYRFSVRAYGDGVTLARDWGEWSSASDEIRTSTCTTTTPTGSIRASPAKIAVNGTTTITASWDNVISTPKIRFGPHLAQTCPDDVDLGAPDTEMEAVETLTLTGCGSTPTILVQLWDVDRNKRLAAVNLKVLSLPKITSFTRRGYRYFQVGFSAHSDYKRVAIEWRNKSANPTIPNRTFAELPATGTPDKPQRAIINHLSKEADIRGLPHLEGVSIDPTAIELRVVGTTVSGLRAVGPAYPVSRDSRPRGIGHLPDHVMMYDDTDLEDSSEDIAKWVKENASSTAYRWASIAPALGLKSCKGTAGSVDDDCPENSDGSVVKIVIGLCIDEDGGACYSVGRGSIERKLDGETKMTFRARPPGVVWTDDPAEDGKRVPESQSGETYLWFGNVLVHEFGHAFGLDDRYGSVPQSSPLGDPIMRVYDGTMRVLAPGDDTIKDDDKAALIAIYETHIKGQGW